MASADRENSSATRLSRTRAVVDQHMRQPVGGLVEFPVGQRPSVARQRHRIRGPRDLRGEQRRAPTSSPSGRVSTARLPSASSRARSGSSSRSTDRQPPLRVGGDRHQHPMQPLDQRLDAGRVEHVGAEFDDAADAVGFAVLGPALRQRERQIHSRGMGVQRQRRGLQIAQGQSRGRVGRVSGQVLPGQHHLDQRVMGQAAGGVEPLDEDLEGHILMLVGGQAAGAHLRQQFGDCRIPVDLDPQDQGVDEEAHQPVECGVAAACDREAYRHIGARADLGQQHRQSGLYHHEAGRVVFARHPGAPAAAVRRASPAARWHRADRRPADRADRWAAAAARASRPARPPSRPAARRWRCRCRQIAELLALPERVVDVLHRQRRPAGGPSRRTGRHRRCPDRAPAGRSTSRRRRCGAPRPPVRAHRRQPGKALPATGFRWPGRMRNAPPRSTASSSRPPATRWRRRRASRIRPARSARPPAGESRPGR